MALSNAELDAIPVDDKGLAIQDLGKLDIEKLTPLTREVIARQATINVGTIGHVAHGKSTVVRSLTDVKTQKHKSEKERNITIKLGYANAKVYRAEEIADATRQYASFGSHKPDTFKENFEVAPGEFKEVTFRLQRKTYFFLLNSQHF